MQVRVYVPATSNVIVARGALELLIEADAPVVVDVQLQLVNAADNASAVPVPLPTPVAVKTTPTVLADAPIAVKSVVPTETI